MHAVAVDAPPKQLYEAGARPTAGGVALVGVAVAAGIAAWYCRPWAEAAPSGGIFAPFEPLFAAFREPGRLALAIGWAGSLAALYAASLGVLGLAQWISSGPVEEAFEWGHVGVTGLWALAALAVLAAGLRLLDPSSGPAGLIWLASFFVEAFYYATKPAPRHAARRRVARRRRRSARRCAARSPEHPRRGGRALRGRVRPGQRRPRRGRPRAARRRRPGRGRAALLLVALYGLIAALVLRPGP